MAAKYRQVGNAVPPPLSAAVGRKLREALDKGVRAVQATKESVEGQEGQEGGEVGVGQGGGHEDEEQAGGEEVAL